MIHEVKKKNEILNKSKRSIKITVVGHKTHIELY